MADIVRESERRKIGEIVSLLAGSVLIAAVLGVVLAARVPWQQFPGSDQRTGLRHLEDFQPLSSVALLTMGTCAWVAISFHERPDRSRRAARFALVIGIAAAVSMSMYVANQLEHSTAAVEPGYRAFRWSLLTAIGAAVLLVLAPDARRGLGRRASGLSVASGLVVVAGMWSALVTGTTAIVAPVFALPFVLLAFGEGLRNRPGSSSRASGVGTALLGMGWLLVGAVLVGLLWLIQNPPPGD